MAAARESAEGPTARLWLPVLVFALALASRLAVLRVRLRHGDLGGYDPSVYYTAAAALLHGRAPYDGDFILLHPPLVMLAGVPFALLGHLTTDYTGFLSETVAFAVLSALTAALVALVVLRHGLPRGAALAAGAFFATWTVTATTGSVLRLEPLGDVLLATALVLLARRRPSRRALLLAGVALGALLTVKLWWVVPVGVVLVATGIRERRWGAFLLPAVAAGLTAAVVVVPFALTGPRMFRALVSDQLERGPLQSLPGGVVGRFPTLPRLSDMTGTQLVGAHFLTGAEVYASTWVRGLAVAVCVLMAGTAALALRTPLGRLAVPLLAVQAAVLLAVPFFFSFYADFVGVAAALVVGAATAVVLTAGRAAFWRLARAGVAAVWPALAAASVVVSVTAPGPSGAAGQPDPQVLAGALRHVGCVVADTPRWLIQADVLDRTLARGCPNVVDFQGFAHRAGPDRTGAVVAGHANAAWRREALAYLGSGDAVLIGDRATRNMLGPGDLARLTTGPLLARTGGVVVRGVPHPRAGSPGRGSEVHPGGGAAARSRSTTIPAWP